MAFTADHPPERRLFDPGYFLSPIILDREQGRRRNRSRLHVHMSSDRLILKLGKIVLLKDLIASIPLLILLFKISMDSFSFISLLMPIMFAVLSFCAGAFLHGTSTRYSNALILLSVVFLGLACLSVTPTSNAKTRFAFWLFSALLMLSIFTFFISRYINATGETVSDHQSAGNTELVLKLGKIIFLMDLVAQIPFLVLFNIQTEPLFFVFFVSAILFSFLSLRTGSLLWAESGSEFTGLSIDIGMLSVVSLGFGSWTVIPVSHEKARLTIWYSSTLLWIIIFIHFLYKYLMRTPMRTPSPGIGRALV